MKHLIIATALFLSANVFSANPLIGNWIAKKKTSENAYSRINSKLNFKTINECDTIANSDSRNDNYMLIGKSVIQFLQIQNPNNAKACKVDNGTISYSYNLKEKWILLEGEANPFIIKLLTADDLVLEE